MIDLEAIVLAGGFGTRLRECIEDIPKPLAPIGGSPFICRILDYFYTNGIHRVIISTGYLAEKIENTIGSRYRGMTVGYSREDSPLGTGGGIKKALGCCTENEVVVVNGDSFFDVDLFEMKKFHEESGCPLTLAAKHIENAYRSGLLNFRNGRLCGLLENGVAPSGYINGGVYFIKRNLLENIAEEKFSFENKILASGNYDIGVYISDGYFIDIGIPESYKLAEENKEKLISKRTRCAVFVDRDGTINKDTVHLFRKEEFEFLPDADKAIAELKKRGYLVIVITNQAGIAKGLYKAEDVDILHNYIDSLLEEKYSVIADGYYYCPHHPQAVIDELRIECECRKPGQGLILNAAEDFKKIGINIDFENSFTVGNRISDVLAGVNAGTGKNILVGSDETDADGIASDVYGSFYEASDNIKQVF